MIDLVTIGHVTLDHTPTGVRPGGAAYYAAITAHRLGLRVALLTSFGPDFPRDALPPDVEIATVPSERTTIFEVRPTGTGRQLAVLSRAADLQEQDLPEAWHEAPRVLLCPVASEVDPALASTFTDAALGVL